MGKARDINGVKREVDRLKSLGRQTLMKDVLKRGADGDGNTALHWAAVKGCLEIVDCLVSSEEGGADANTLNQNRETALHMAAGSGRHHVVEWLVEQGGADINAIDINGLSALHCAAVGGHKVIMEWLVLKRVDPAAINSNGSSALHIAAHHGHTDIVRWLIDPDANPPLLDLNAERSSDGKTPLHLAAENNKDDVVRILVNYGGADPGRLANSGETASDLATGDTKKFLENEAPGIFENKQAEFEASS